MSILGLLFSVWLVSVKGLKINEDNCTETSQCPGVARCLASGCLGSTCLCPEGYMPSDDFTQCLNVVELGESCTSPDVRCRLPYAWCSGGVCECLPGHMRAADNMRCKIKSFSINSARALLGEDCSGQILCNDGNTMVCQEGKCACKTGYRPSSAEELSAHPYSGECVSSNFTLGYDISAFADKCIETVEGGLTEIGGSCVADTNCPGNATCRQIGCEHKCSCGEGFAASSDRKRCLELVPLNEPCSDVTVCEDMFTRCSDVEKEGKCVCDVGYEEVNSLCRKVSSFPGYLRWATINETCGSNIGAIPVECQSDLRCVDDKCQCSGLFREATVLERISFNPPGYCIPKSASIDVDVNDAVCEEPNHSPPENTTASLSSPAPSSATASPPAPTTSSSFQQSTATSQIAVTPAQTDSAPVTVSSQFFSSDSLPPMTTATQTPTEATQSEQPSVSDIPKSSVAETSSVPASQSSGSTMTNSEVPFETSSIETYQQSATQSATSMIENTFSPSQGIQSSVESMASSSPFPESSFNSGMTEGSDLLNPSPSSVTAVRSDVLESSSEGASESEIPASQSVASTSDTSVSELASSQLVASSSDTVVSEPASSYSVGGASNKEMFSESVAPSISDIDAQSSLGSPESTSFTPSPSSQSTLQTTSGLGTLEQSLSMSEDTSSAWIADQSTAAESQSMQSTSVESQGTIQSSPVFSPSSESMDGSQAETVSSSSIISSVSETGYNAVTSSVMDSSGNISPSSSSDATSDVFPTSTRVASTPVTVTEVSPGSSSVASPSPSITLSSSEATSGLSSSSSPSIAPSSVVDSSPSSAVVTSTPLPTPTTARVGVLDSCEDSSACPVNGACVRFNCTRKQCQCKPGYFPSVSGAECLRGVRLGEECNDTISCSVPSSMCSQDTKRCECIPPLENQTPDGFCTNNVPSVGMPCNDICRDIFAICNANNTCVCEPGFRKQSDEEVFSSGGKDFLVLGRCLPDESETNVPQETTTQCDTHVVGDTCTSSIRCPDNSKCTSAIGECKSRCWCDLGYAPSPDKKSCIPVVKIGERCTRDTERCISSLSKCIDGVCKCIYGYIVAANNTLCKPKGYLPYYGLSALGEECTNKFRCFLKHEQECVAGVCTCKAGLRPAMYDDLSAEYYNYKQCRNSSTSVGFRPALKCSDPAIPQVAEPDFDDLLPKSNSLALLTIVAPVVVVVAALIATIYTIIRRRRRSSGLNDNSSTTFESETDSEANFRLPRPQYLKSGLFRDDRSWTKSQNTFNNSLYQH